MTKDCELLPGARSAPVFRRSGITEECIAKLGTKPEGNSRRLDGGSWRRMLAFAVADEVIAPGDDFARSIERGLQEMEAAGTIVVVRHIVFARPQQLHGHAGLFRDVGGLHHVVVIETAAERRRRAAGEP